MDLERLAARPYLFTFFLMVVLILTGIFASLLISLLNFPGENVQIYRVLIEDTLRGSIAIALLSRLGWWRSSGYKPLERNRDLLLFWLALVPAVINLLLGVHATSLSNIFLFLFIALLVGFVEESYFRGLALHALESEGPWRAAIISAVLFGLLHFLNLAAGWNTAYVVQQVMPGRSASCTRLSPPARVLSGRLC